MFLFFNVILFINVIINFFSGAFSSILADYQRVDVMLFIILKIPQLNKAKNQSEAEHDIGLSSSV